MLKEAVIIYLNLQNYVKHVSSKDDVFFLIISFIRVWFLNLYTVTINRLKLKLTTSKFVLLSSSAVELRARPRLYFYLMS